MKEMAGGVLVVVDRLGRPSRRFPLDNGLATLGRDPDNDIRITLPEVEPHHATVLIHDAQAVIRSTGGGVTLLNGRAVSVAPLRHGDIISVGGRALRWEYSRPRAAPPRLPSPVGEPMPAVPRRARGRERGRSAPGAGNARDRTVQLALEMAHRASMPGSTGGKQVAIVQPQRRETADHTDKYPARASPLTTRRSNYEPSTSVETEDKSKRKSATSKNLLQNTTKATLWIESRKTSPRKKAQTPPQLPPARRSLPAKKSTPLRMTVLKKAQSAYKTRVIKIEAPLKIDHTKQAAIMLMTGHTPKSKLSITPKNSSSKKSPSYLVLKPSPVRKTPRGKSGRLSRGSKSTGSAIGVTPSRGSDFAQRSSNRRSSKRHTAGSVSIFEISDSTQNSTGHTSQRSTPSGKSPTSPSLPSPKKSAMKDRSKKSLRKTESIKFDLSNLESHQENDTLSRMNKMRYERDDSEDITLRYSESSAHSQSPSPRRSIHSRSSRMLEQVGASLISTPASPSRPFSSDSPQGRRSLRGSAMVQRVMETSAAFDRTRSDLSADTSASDRTRSDLGSTVLSDRTRSDLSTLVASDRSRSRLSVNSIASDHTRSDLSATPASDRTRSRLSVNTIASDRTRSDLSATRESDRTRSDLSATRVSDRTRSDLSSKTVASNRTRSRLSANETIASAFRTRTLSPRHNLESYSVVDLVSFESEDVTKSVYDSADSATSSVFGTPAVSARKTRSTIDPVLLGSSTPYAGRNRASRSKSNSNNERIRVVSMRRSKSLTTPENGQPVVVTRPPRTSRSRSRIHDDLSLLDLTEPDDSSPRTSKRSRTNVSEMIDMSNVDLSNNTDIGVTTPENRRSPEVEGTPVLSIRSLLDSSRGSVASGVKDRDERETVVSGPARRSRLRLSREPAASEDEGTITPTSAAKPSTESVKNKHSTAKKPQSKRSIIDDLNRSDIIKELFRSPVKRKLTQSMSEYSRKRLFEEDEDEKQARRPTRRTIATAASAPLLVETNDAKAGGDSLRNSRKRKSAKNDLSDVRGVKALFGKLPKDDLRRVTGVGTFLRKTSPRNDLTDVRGIRKMFQQKSPVNDLRNVTGVKHVLRTSPKNDLTDVRGVRRMFKGVKRKASYQDVSGIEELFQSSERSVDRSEELFDAMVGRPPIKAVYSRTFGGRETRHPTKGRRSLHTSVDVNNVEEWLEKELRRHLPSEASASRRVTKELQKLATDTVEGAVPIILCRTRKSSFKSTSVRNASPGNKSPAVVSPARARRPVQCAVHSTPLKGRLQVTMNASELGRVSPIAGPSGISQIDRDCFVSLSTETIDEKKKSITKGLRPPRKQTTPRKMELQKQEVKNLEKPSGRATRTNKSVETAVPNTRRRRSSLVVTKKVPGMSPKATQSMLTTNSQKESPKHGTSRTRARGAKATLVIAKPSPKLKPRSVKASGSSQIEPANRSARNDAKNIVDSPKASPKGKRKARAEATKNKPQTKGRRTKTEEVAQVDQSSQPKRSRRTNTVDTSAKETSKIHNSVIRTRRGKAAAAKLDTEEKNTKSRGRKVQNQTSIQSVIEEKRSTTRGKKIQTQTIDQIEIEEKKTHVPGKRVQTQTNVQSKTEEKTNTRGKRGQIQNSIESEAKEQNTNTRSKKAQPQTSVESETGETNKTNFRSKRGQNKISIEIEAEEKKINTRGKKAQSQTSVESEPGEKKPNRRGQKVQFETPIQPEPSTRRGRTAKQEENEPKRRGNTVQSSLNIESQSATRGRRAKTDVSIIETRRGKRKAAIEEDRSDTVPQPKKGKMMESPAKKSTAKQKGNISKEAKIENTKEETTKSRRATRVKPVEEPVKTETTRARARKVTETKEKVPVSTRGKRKAIVDPSPAKAAAKKAATSITPTPAPRARRAARPQLLPLVPTKNVRGRRR